MAEWYKDDLTTLAKRLRPLMLFAVSSSAAVGGLFDRIWHIPVTGDAVPYAKTDAGLDAATAAIANAGDVIWIFDCALTANHTLGNAIYYNQGSVMSGQITLAAGARLYDAIITRTANSGATLVGVVGQATGTAYLYGCQVSVTQSGAGAAYALNVAGGGDVAAHECDLSGVSMGGAGYAGRSSSGRLYLYGGKASGSTARFSIVTV